MNFYQHLICHLPILQIFIKYCFVLHELEISKKNKGDNIFIFIVTNRLFSYSCCVVNSISRPSPLSFFTNSCKSSGIDDKGTINPLTITISLKGLPSVMC